MMDNIGDNNKKGWSGMFSLPYTSLRFRFMASILPAIFFVGLLFIFTLTAFVRSTYDSRVNKLGNRIISRYGENFRTLIQNDSREELAEMLRTIAQNNNFLMLKISDNQKRTHAGYLSKSSDQSEKSKEYTIPFQVLNELQTPESWQLRIKIRQDFFFKFIDMFMLLQLFLLLILFTGLLITIYISFDHLIFKQLNKFATSLKQFSSTSLPAPIQVDSFDEFANLFAMYNQFIDRSTQAQRLSNLTLHNAELCLTLFDLKSGVLFNPESVSEILEDTDFTNFAELVNMALNSANSALKAKLATINDQITSEDQGRIVFQFSIETSQTKTDEQWLEAIIIWDKQITPNIGGLLLKDFTTGKLKEIKQIERETHFKDVFDRAPVGLWQSRGDRFTIINKTMANMLGYESQDAAFAKVRSIRTDAYVHTLDYGFFTDEIKKRGRVKGLEVQVKRRSGQYFWAEISGQAFHDYSSLCVFGSLIDITQRKLAKDTLRESEQLLRSCVEAAQTLCYVADLTSESMNIQGPILEILGPKSTDITTISSFLKRVLPADFEKVSSILKCKSTPSSTAKPVNIYFSVCCPEANGHIRTKKLKLVCNSYTQGSTSQITFQKGIMTVITEAERQVDSSIAEDETIEQLIREIRNPLNAVSGFCELLKEHSTDETGQEYANSILKASRDLTKLTSVLLAKIALRKPAGTSQKPADRKHVNKEYKQFRFSLERVLIADDVASNRQMLFMALTKANLEVIVAEDGFEAVRMAKLYKPHLIFMDIMMPRKDGITAAKELKADPSCRKIPIVAITVKENGNMEIFDEYLYKPVRLSELFNVTKKFLNLSNTVIIASDELAVPVEAFEQIENPEILRSRLLNILIPQLEKLDSEKNFESTKQLAITLREICLDHSFNFLALEAEQLSVGSVLRDANAVKNSLNRIRACIKKYLQVFGNTTVASI